MLLYLSPSSLLSSEAEIVSDFSIVIICRIIFVALLKFSFFKTKANSVVLLKSGG